MREGNVAGRELLAKMQHETTLHFQDDVGEPLGIGAELGDSVEATLRGGGGIQTA